MSPLKRFFARDDVRRVLCWLAAQYIRLVYATGRWTVVGGETLRRLWAEGRPFIVAFWHGRLLMMPYAWERGRPFHMLISQHRDGQLIARTVGHLGIQTAAGSSTRGGAGALRVMVRALAAGDCVGITPDGPRGPRMRASDGIISVARLAGVPILPATVATSRRAVLGTWDRFVVALPFSRGVFIWGDPIAIARDADEDTIEAARRALEDAMNAINAEADRRVGQTPIEPGPPLPRGATVPPARETAP